jgi:tripartite-type tricarboxylate transporter receptor subunit TctC
MRAGRRAPLEETLRGIRIAITALAAMLAITAAMSAGLAQANYPARVVKLIVPYPPGGGTDLLARVLADQLGRKWGQSVIVENVGGAGGNIGGAEVFRADPDGYTLLLASPGPIATNAYMYKDMSYDPAKWVPIAVLATSPYVLVLNNGFDAQNLPLLLTHAKANPGRLTAATPGVGSVGQLATVELELLADIKLLQIPYKGLSPAVADVLAGNVDMMFDMLATSLPLYRAQKEKIIAVGSTERVKDLPDVPTLAEAGVPGYRAVTFFGIVAPPATPDALADKINRDVAESLVQPELIEKTKALGMDLAPGSRTEAAQFFAAERELWGKVAKQANLAPTE